MQNNTVTKKSSNGEWRNEENLNKTMLARVKVFLVMMGMFGKNDIHFVFLQTCDEKINWFVYDVLIQNIF